MAANLKSGASGIAIASLGKRLLNRTSARRRCPAPSPSPPPTFVASRSAHTSAYDKNHEDHAHPTVVPDDVIQPGSDKYWEPDPKTGVFGPATKLNATAGGEQGLPSSLANGGLNSALEEKAWFRPTSIEDLEKPHHH